MEKVKYYIPKIEEFCVGFQYELLNKFVYNNSLQIYDVNATTNYIEMTYSSREEEFPISLISEFLKLGIIRVKY